MEFRFIDDETVEIEGYVNAIERESKILKSRLGDFIEKICEGAFKRAIERNNDIRMLENHDWDKTLASTLDGNLQLEEDNIGLKACAIIKDKEAIEKARSGEYIGWSFGFRDVVGGVIQHFINGVLHREVKDLDLLEVSILDRTKTPAYKGTLVTVRENEDIVCHSEPYIETREQPKQLEEVVKKEIDYTRYEQLIKELKENVLRN